MAEAADDTAALADHLGADSFLVAGWSGGGDPALACAALLPERVRACISIAGLIPPHEVEKDLDWLAWYSPTEREQVRKWMTENLDHLIPEYESEAKEFAATTVQSFDESGLPQVDMDANHRYPAAAEAIAEGMRRGVSTGIWEMVGDDQAWANLWGFRLSDIRVPVTIRHGTVDTSVPVEQGRWLAAHIPGAHAQIIEGEGHVSIGMPFEPVIDALLEALPSTPPLRLAHGGADKDIAR